MSHKSTALHRNRPSLTWLFSAGLLALLLPLSQAAAIEVVAVEEHWELSVGEPDGSVSGPQITMIMSPTADLDGDFFIFTLNYRSDPEFTPGGMQVQHWYGEDLEYSQQGAQQGVLRFDNEVVSWVQRVELANGSLTFSINNGQSESWGSFGDQGYLRVSMPTNLTNLNNYQPSISIGDSGVNFAGNRVKSLVLTKLRWYDSEGNVHELTAPIDVDTDIDP